MSFLLDTLSPTICRIFNAVKKGIFVGYAARYFHKKYTDVYVKYPLFFCWILMKLEYSRQIFEKYI